VTIAIPEDIAKLSFEDALAELDKIVRTLESGSAKLDESISAYERGSALKVHCESKLKEAQARVERIILGADGGISLDPNGL
jgi:exodeoxyribonuclease VII small subunit